MKILGLVIIGILLFLLNGIKGKLSGCCLKSKPTTPKPNTKPVAQKGK